MRRVFCRSSNTIAARWEIAKGARSSRKKSWTHSRHRFVNMRISGTISCRFGQKHESRLFFLFASVQFFGVCLGYECVRDAMAGGAVESENVDGGFYANAKFEDAEAAIARAGTAHFRGPE